MTGRTTPRRKRTRRFDVGIHLPATDCCDFINGQGVGDLVRAVLPYLDADSKKDLGLADQEDGAKVGEDFEIGEFVPYMDQEETYALVEAALPHLDEAEIFQLVMDELSPAGRDRLLKLLQNRSYRTSGYESAPEWELNP
jgi:hypothetical protein